MCDYEVLFPVSVTAANPEEAARFALDDIRDRKLESWNATVTHGDVTVTVNVDGDGAAARIVEKPADLAEQSARASGGMLVQVHRDQAVWERETLQVFVPADVPKHEVNDFVRQQIDANRYTEISPPFILDDSVDGVDTQIKIHPST
ncbi:hypothetical protein [Cupriavidus sp. TMH.W2]|uniref:hypothetical protein n=1 Tax=Cupriavidus sp. TMH.W2 TaxID=3434465 RepID=UPI003D789656